MKKYIFILAFLLMTIVSCTNKNQNVSKVDVCFEDETINIPYRYDPKDSVTVYLEIYEPNEKIKPVLDSIVEITRNCDGIDLRKTDFVFTYDSIARNKSNVQIRTTETRFYHNPATNNGIFYYNGCRFFYDGRMLNVFFNFTGEFEIIKAVDPRVYEILGIDDRQLYWMYILKDGDLINSEYSNCDSIYPVD